jgi:hypothetical protein
MTVRDKLFKSWANKRGREPAGLPDFSLLNIPKTKKYIRNGHKIY